MINLLNSWYFLRSFSRVGYFLSAILGLSQRGMINTHSKQRNASTEIMDLNVAATNGNGGPTASADPPQLRYLDQTPNMRTDNRSLCSQLSPLGEEEQASLTQNNQLAVQDAIEKAIPKIIGQLEMPMQDTIMKTIESALAKKGRLRTSSAQRDESLRRRSGTQDVVQNREAWKKTVEKIFSSLDWRKMWGRRMVAN